MKLKISATIFIGFIFAIIISATGQIVGEEIKKEVAESSFSEVLDEVQERELSRMELYKLIISPKYSSEFTAANRVYNEKVKVYTLLVWATQLIFLVLLAYGCGCVVTKMVRRNGQL